MNIIHLISSIESIEDPRSKRTVYPLGEIVFLVISAKSAGLDTFTEIIDWGEEHLDFLRDCTSYPYKEGIPSHDTVNSLIRNISPSFFQELLDDCLEDAREHVEGHHIAIDGKVRRGSKRIMVLPNCKNVLGCI